MPTKSVNLKQYVDRLSDVHPARAEYAKLIRDRNALVKRLKKEAEDAGDSFRGNELRELIGKVSAKPKPKAKPKPVRKAKLKPAA